MRHRFRRPLRTLLLGALVVLIAAAPAHARAWDWALSDAQYKALNNFQRAQYDRAAKLVKEKQYKAAAAEFEKFKVQFGATLPKEMLAYVIFMRGYCLHHAKFRNEAIKVYQEVLDYFGDTIDAGAPALYYMGVAYLDNGDTRDGMECMLEMVEDPDYSKHPLAAGALNRLADNHWRNEEKEQAIAYWKRVVGFWSVNPHHARDAFEKVTRYYVANGQYDAYLAWRLESRDAENPKDRKDIAHNAYEAAHHVFHDRSGYYNQFSKKEMYDDARTFMAWFRNQKDWFLKASDPWQYYHDCLHFLAHRLHDKAIIDEVSDGFFAWIGKVKDERWRNDRLDWAVDRFGEMGRWEHAQHAIGMISDAPRAAYKEYQILVRQHKWKEGIERLEAAEQMGSDYWERRARRERGEVYLHRLHQYDKAVEVFRLCDPPWSLWQIQECRVRQGRLDAALQTLAEIEGSFPDDASKAAWRRAELYHKAGKREQTVAECRRILKKYPKSRESSEAHQLLEKLGVEVIGGGVHREE
ncbi:MAG: tetratricopeptide repeat protein [Planctomycetota bacterium]